MFKHALVQATVVDAILASVRDIAELLRQGDSSGQVGSVNAFGDKQLKVAAIQAPFVLWWCPVTVCCNVFDVVIKWHGADRPEGRRYHLQQSKILWSGRYCIKRGKAPRD